MFIKIQSISDIITNSSSEVFVIYDQRSVKEFKEVISTLIGEDFDNRFEIEYEFADWTYDEYEQSDDKDTPFEEWCFEYDQNSYEGSTAVIGINIIAKNPEDNKLASAIASLPYIFDYEERYC